MKRNKLKYSISITTDIRILFFLIVIDNASKYKEQNLFLLKSSAETITAFPQKYFSFLCVFLYTSFDSEQKARDRNIIVKVALF